MSENIPSTYWKIVAVPFVFVGACAVLVSISLLVKTAVFHATSVSTLGTIERVETRAGRSIQFFPIYSFRDNSGKPFQHEGILCGRDRWQEGESVLVRYDPKDPDKSALACLHDIWMVPLLFSAFSGVYFFATWRFFRAISKPDGFRSRSLQAS